jgi:hypothetical protein
MSLATRRENSFPFGRLAPIISRLRHRGAVA